MRPAPAERSDAEEILKAAGWIKVALPRTPVDHQSNRFIEMMKWCEDHIGPGRVEIEAGKINNDDLWYSYSWYGYWNFWFQHEQDATAFALRCL